MNAWFKKCIVYGCAIFINQAFFLSKGSAITSSTLPNEQEISSFSSHPQPIQAPAEPQKITNNPNQILARVNNQTITVKDVEQLTSNLPKELKQLPKEILYPQLIKQLILDYALTIAIQKDGIDKKPEIQENIHTAVKELTRQKLAQAYFIEKLKPSLTPQAIQTYYNQHYLHKPQIKEVHLRQIIVQAPEITEIIYTKLQKGLAFSDLAALYSIDLQNRDSKKGDVGWFDVNTLNPSVKNAIESLTYNDYTKKPIQTNYGWVIFQKVGERIRPVPSLNSVRQEIKEQITKESINNLYEESLKNVHIIEY